MSDAARPDAAKSTPERDGSGKSDAPPDARVARTRADVSRAALRVLRDAGWEDVTHARVAEVAGYSKTTLYVHWPTRADLIVLALEAFGDPPHQRLSGDLRADLVGELTVFRDAVARRGLVKILSGMTQWASVAEIADLRARINAEGQRQLRGVLSSEFAGARLDAVVSMLSGVVACPALMFGTLPTDEEIEAAVDVVLAAR